MLRLLRAAHDAMIAHAVAGYPNEVVGLLARRIGDPLIVRIVPLVNEQTAAPRTRFVVTKAARLAAETALSADGFENAGMYHSHPDGVAHCSDDDRVSLKPHVPNIIVAVGHAGETTLRAWIRTPPDVVEPLAIELA